MIFLFIFILGWFNDSHAANFLPDESEIQREEALSYQLIDSYSHALGIWETAEDINKWVAGNFTYDRARAINLSSNKKKKNKGISIYSPCEFFQTKGGVCVDLARFGVETLRIIDPDSDPKYLMIEFDPIQINSNTFRLHWLVGFKKNGMKYFFCDSKRPGYIAGPYNNTQVFISGYERYRGRKIVAYRELESYKKQKKLQSAKGRKKSANKTDAADR